MQIIDLYKTVRAMIQCQAKGKEFLLCQLSKRILFQNVTMQC